MYCKRNNIKIYDKDFYYDEKYISTEEFEDLMNIQENLVMYKDILKKLGFSGTRLEKNFYIANTKFLDKDLQKDLDLGSVEVFDNKLNIKEDPIIGNVPNSFENGNLAMLQNLIVDIHSKYGKEGLDNARSIYLGRSITDDYQNLIHYYSGKDLIGVVMKNNKYFQIKKPNKSFGNRVMDAVKPDSSLRVIENPVIKSAFFNLPSLIYKEDGTMINEIEMLTLNKQFLLKAKQFDFYSSLNIAEEIMVDNKFDQIETRYQLKKVR